MLIKYLIKSNKRSLSRVSGISRKNEYDFHNQDSWISKYANFDQNQNGTRGWHWLELNLHDN